MLIAIHLYYSYRLNKPFKVITNTFRTFYALKINFKLYRSILVVGRDVMTKFSMSHTLWRNMSQHIIIYIHASVYIINIINVLIFLFDSSKVSIFIFYFYLAIYYIIMNAAM